uniref:Uncharacterized protein n=1 Tax=viral metagenome TaxID=1070528 RepID=A0A6M3IXL9_9ZZZZ
MAGEKGSNEFEGINRARPKDFASYWKSRPYHFKELFGCEATNDNIKTAFQELKRKSLICAVTISDGCICRYCKKERLKKALSLKETMIDSLDIEEGEDEKEEPDDE